MAIRYPSVLNVRFKMIFTIPGYQDVSIGYAVGDDGSVWSRHQPPRGLIGDTWNPLTIQTTGPLGLSRQVVVKGGRKKPRGLLIGRLVLSAFVGHCPPGLEACHKDGNPDNNFVENLRWGTHKSNQEDMVKHGRSLAGERHWNSKLKEEDVIQIREAYRMGLANQRTLARCYGVHFTLINQIVNRKIWGHIP